MQEFETRMLKAKTKKDKGIAKREHDRLRAKATVMLSETIQVQQAHWLCLTEIAHCRSCG